MTGKQLRVTVQQVKNLGEELNHFLYEDGNLKKNQSIQHPQEEFTKEECLEKLERIRQNLWWIYNDNQEFAEIEGFGKFS